MSAVRISSDSDLRKSENKAENSADFPMTGAEAENRAGRRSDCRKRRRISGLFCPGITRNGFISRGITQNGLMQSLITAAGIFIVRMF